MPNFFFFFFFWWGRGGFPGVSGSTYAMKLKLTPGMALDEEVDWWRHQSCHVTHVHFIDQKSFLLTSTKMADDVINQLLWSMRLPRVGFNLIACLEPVKKDDNAEILVCKFHLGSRKTCLRMCRRMCHQIFYAKMLLRKFCSLGQSFMQNHQGVPELF